MWWWVSSRTGFSSLSSTLSLLSKLDYRTSIMWHCLISTSKFFFKNTQGKCRIAHEGTILARFHLHEITPLCMFNQIHVNQYWSFINCAQANTATCSGKLFSSFNPSFYYYYSWSSVVLHSLTCVFKQQRIRAKKGQVAFIVIPNIAPFIYPKQWWEKTSLLWSADQCSHKRRRDE